VAQRAQQDGADHTLDKETEILRWEDTTREDGGKTFYLFNPLRTGATGPKEVSLRWTDTSWPEGSAGLPVLAGLCVAISASARD